MGQVQASRPSDLERGTMSVNDLLLWMSARGGGSWAQFRAAVERLYRSDPEMDEDDNDAEASDPAALPLYQELRLNLERFGFAEFFSATTDHDWRVTPPVLAVSQAANAYTGFIIGARSDRLIRRVEIAAPRGSLRVEPVEHSPDSLSVESDELSTLGVLASAVGLVFQQDAPNAILATLRAVDSAVMGQRVDVPIGKEWSFERFLERELRWGVVTRTDMESAPFGLFRLRFRYRTEILMRWSGISYVTSLQEAKYLALKRARKTVLNYDAGTLTFSVPAICRPPTLIERALLLCSGRLPAFEIRRGAPAFLHYQRIPRIVARTASALLRQELG